MLDPNSYLHAVLEVGSGRVEIVNRNGQVVLGCRRRSDMQAIKGMREYVEARQAELALKKAEDPCKSPST